MAMKPMRPCRKPGCPNLTRDGWCPDHKPKAAKRGKSAEWHWMYLLPVWKDDLRPTQLLLEPFCRECAKRGYRTRANEVDHVKPHRGDMAIFTDRSNLQSLCHRCHSAKTMREQHEKRRNISASGRGKRR